MRTLIAIIVLSVWAVGAQTPHPRYEYKVVHKLKGDDLAKFGDEGWQLVAATEDDGFADYFFAREK